MEHERQLHSIKSLLEDGLHLVWVLSRFIPHSNNMHGKPTWNSKSVTGVNASVNGWLSFFVEKNWLLVRGVTLRSPLDNWNRLQDPSDLECRRN